MLVRRTTSDVDRLSIGDKRKQYARVLATSWQTHAGTRIFTNLGSSFSTVNSRVFVSAASKKGRQTYQRYQTSVLEQKFQQSSYVSKKQREELRLQTNLTDRQIKIWFQNRRMKWKKDHKLPNTKIRSGATAGAAGGPPGRPNGGPPAL